MCCSEAANQEPSFEVRVRIKPPGIGTRVSVLGSICQGKPFWVNSRLTAGSSPNWPLHRLPKGFWELPWNRLGRVMFIWVGVF